MKRFAALAVSTLLCGASAPAQQPGAAPPEITPVPTKSATPAATPANSPTPIPSPTATPAPKAAHTPPLSPRAIADSLNEGEVEELLGILKKSYLNPQALRESELRRATVQGLIERLGPGLSVSPPPRALDRAGGNFRSEVIADRIGYARVGALSRENLAALDAALADFVSRGLGSVILELRATPPSSDFELGAEFVKRFAAKGQELFTIKRGASEAQDRLFTSNVDPKFGGVLVVLVDSETAGAAEVVAAVLRKAAKALIVGENTVGQAVEFEEARLASGKTVRIAVAEAALPGGATLFPQGVKPDIIVPMPQEVREELMRQSAEQGVTPFVSETERPHMNEAALVAGINPELEAIQAAQRNKAEQTKTLRDLQLQRALDLITTIGIYEKKPAKK